MEYLHKDLTNNVIKAFYNVYNNLGYGFLETVYENSMIIELQKMGLHCKKQQSIKVYYQGIEVGDYFADIIVNDLLIIELKAASSIIQEHEFQLINYLKATNIEIGLLLNFGEKPEIKRKIFTNNIKNIDV